eukprot:scaffold3020_cov342-Prasinococcus_capsulatus_cf.AAC.6
MDASGRVALRLLGPAPDTSVGASVGPGGREETVRVFARGPDPRQISGAGGLKGPGGGERGWGFIHSAPAPLGARRFWRIPRTGLGIWTGDSTILEYLLTPPRYIPVFKPLTPRPARVRVGLHILGPPAAEQRGRPRAPEGGGRPGDKRGHGSSHERSPPAGAVGAPAGRRKEEGLPVGAQIGPPSDGGHMIGPSMLTPRPVRRPGALPPPARWSRPSSQGSRAGGAVVGGPARTRSCAGWLVRAACERARRGAPREGACDRRQHRAARGAGMRGEGGQGGRRAASRGGGRPFLPARARARRRARRSS